MLRRKRKYALYSDTKKRRHSLSRGILIGLGFFLLYSFITGFIVSFRVLDNDSMQPSLHAGDFMLFSSYKLHNLFDGEAADEPAFTRGSIVLVDMGLKNDTSLLSDILDGLVRLLTVQRVSPYGRGEDLYVKRVLALPGDEVSMTNFVLRVKPSGRSYSLTEFEVSEREYNVNIPQVPAIWDESLPLSGNMASFVLGYNECFVLSDDRSTTNDSRTWGAVPSKCIAGKALFRYWPPNSLGTP